jgi:hypothetical protein
MIAIIMNINNFYNYKYNENKKNCYNKNNYFDYNINYLKLLFILHYIIKKYT